MDTTPLVHPPKRRRALAVALSLALLIGALGAAAIIGDWFEADDAVAESTTTTLPPTTTTTARPYEVPPTQLLATPAQGADIPIFDAPNGAQRGTFGHWYGYLQTTNVLEERDGFLRIRLPERPNMDTAWVRATDVTTSTSAYRIVINVTTTMVTVYKDGFTLYTMPGGMGKASTPTPLGNYYLAVIEYDVPGYGAYVLDLNAHSEAIESWEGSGDAIIALHGPISASSDARIGTTGTHISNGCIRLHTEDQLKLAEVPLGSPVDIVA